MPNLSIRNLDKDTYLRLRKRAAENGRSMEAEARAVLDKAANEPPFDREAFVAELRRRRLARSGGRVTKDSVPGIRRDRESR